MSYNYVDENGEKWWSYEKITHHTVTYTDGTEGDIEIPFKYSTDGDYHIEGDLIIFGNLSINLNTIAKIKTHKERKQYSEGFTLRRKIVKMMLSIYRRFKVKRNADVHRCIIPKSDDYPMGGPFIWIPSNDDIKNNVKCPHCGVGVNE